MREPINFLVISVSLSVFISVLFPSCHELRVFFEFLVLIVLTLSFFPLVFVWHKSSCHTYYTTNKKKSLPTLPFHPEAEAVSNRKPWFLERSRLQNCRARSPHPSLTLDSVLSRSTGPR